jgi:hypothetical protein
VLLQTHHNQLVTTPAARPMLTVLKDKLYATLKVIIGLEFCKKKFYKVNVVFSIYTIRNYMFNLHFITHVR